MLSMQDVLDYCDLDRGEIEAIAEHEHIPTMLAAELSENLLSSPEGVFRLHSMIIENMQQGRGFSDGNQVKTDVDRNIGF